MSEKLRCKKCGHERLITAEWLASLAVANIETCLPRFKCSRCSARAIVIIKLSRIPAHKEARKPTRRPAPAPVIIKLPRIPAHSGFGFPVSQTEQRKISHTKWILGMDFSSRSGLEKDEPVKWSKKTCPACNGGGLEGHCYKCEGTGWVEATF